MDTSDPSIIFDSNGVCDYCLNFQQKLLPIWHESISADISSLTRIADKVRNTPKKSPYDCIIGLSGGLDSSYVTYVATELMGLRPLLFHVDAGWNTERAVSNIEKLVDGLGLDLYTEVINWNSIKRMQLAFLRSGIPDQDLVQDAVFFSSLYKYARKNNIRFVLTGSNISTEACREPEEWGGYLGIDRMLFSDIWRKYGDGKPIADFPILDILTYKVLYQRIAGMQILHPLNHVRFIKKEAEQYLNTRFGWQPFQHKHHESRFTRYYEDFWLKTRFGYDKRKAHFSSLIMTGQMTRANALDRLEHDEMGSHFLAQETDFIARKLGLQPSQLYELHQAPKNYCSNLRSKRRLIKNSAKILRRLGIEKRFFR